MLFPTTLHDRKNFAANVKLIACYPAHFLKMKLIGKLVVTVPDFGTRPGG